MRKRAFSIQEYFHSKGVNAEEKATTIYEQKQAFKTIGNFVKEEIHRKISESDKTEGDELLNRQEKAITGDPKEIKYFINMIQTILEDKNLKSNSFPSYYSSLEEAIFHEIYGLKLLQKWYNLFPYSEAAEFNGTEFRIEVNGQLEIQEERLESIEEIYEIIRVFLLKYGQKFNEENPILEVTMEDGSRVTVIGPPFHDVPVVTFRRFIVKNFTLEKQAELKTINYRDIEMLRALARTYCNMVIAGKVRSAKTTFLKTLFSVRDTRDNVILIEKNKELALKRSFPKHEGSLREFEVEEGSLHDIYPTILRKEHDYVIIGEVRSTEIEAALQACERGNRGLMTTYHLTNVDKVVPQLARQVLASFPSYSQKSQEERIAESFDIIITMGKKRHSNEKRVTSISEVRLTENDEVQVNTFMKLVGDHYVYHSNISDELLAKMNEEDPEATDTFMKVLKERAAASPMKSVVNAV
jgi:pilus assembly protein CpaF